MLNKTKCIERSVFIFRALYIILHNYFFEFDKMQILISECVR